METTNQNISQAVATFRKFPAMSDEEIYGELVKEGVDRRLAARLVEFVPMAYGRILLEKSGAQFSDVYHRLLPGGTRLEHLLSSEPVWNAAFDFGRAEIADRTSAADLLAVAARSAEFDAADKMLKKGSRLQNLVFTPPLLPWSDGEPNV
ncbi:MAG TPA: hypothetical protein VK302_07270 [Terriglobales bacterium]|nr:hypothetical protein [Terriglobales bacterium]